VSEANSYFSCFFFIFSETQYAVSLPNGFLVLLSHKKIIDCCETGACDVSRISLFHTYDPYCKHYLLSTKQSLIIVSQEESLEVTPVVFCISCMNLIFLHA